MQLLSVTLAELTRIFKNEYGKGGYHAAALYRQVYKYGSLTPLDAEQFTRSPVLSRQLEHRISICPGRVVQTVKQDGLIKFVTQLHDGAKIESVVIPMTRHNTLCVSSQLGCRMGCRFCQTGKMGLVRNLNVNEIVGQLFNARFVLKENIKNIVFMGMGEPLDNFDNCMAAVRIFNEQKGFDVALRHITISTAGLPRGIERLAGLNLKGLRLAISINAAHDQVRTRLMPVNRAFPLAALKQALSTFPLPNKGCFLFEYILIKGLNDSPKDAIHLADYIKSLPVRLNLIPYNPVDGFNYTSPSDDEMNKFAQVLTDKGVFVVKRWSKGRSVSAGCGQLGRSTKTVLIPSPAASCRA